MLYAASGGDGDSWHDTAGREYRLGLVNTPEANECYGSAATATNPPSRGNCDASYPTVCIPPPPPDLDCGEISYRNFTVLAPDPHGFDGDGDGIGCEQK